MYNNKSYLFIFLYFILFYFHLRFKYIIWNKNELYWILVNIVNINFCVCVGWDVLPVILIPELMACLFKPSVYLFIPGLNPGVCVSVIQSSLRSVNASCLSGPRVSSLWPASSSCQLWVCWWRRPGVRSQRGRSETKTFLQHD